MCDYPISKLLSLGRLTLENAHYNLVLATRLPNSIKTKINLPMGVLRLKKEGHGSLLKEINALSFKEKLKL